MSQHPAEEPASGGDAVAAGGGSGGAAAVGGKGTCSYGFLQCRQSSSRWIPTSDQIRILKDLYYNSGLRSPTAEQIQRISARLRQYGKIEGKNVFYWFQNHKARERQKKRLTVEVPPPNPSAAAAIYPGVSPSPTGVYAVAHHVGSFRGCCGVGGGANVVDSGMGWLGVDASTVPQYYYQQQQQHRPIYYYEGYYPYQLRHKEEEQEEEAAHIETLPLFPVHRRGDHAGDGGLAPYLSRRHHHHQQPLHCSGDTSLELTLNSSYYPRP